MSFCTAINCLDGRTHEPVIEYLKERFDVRYVDMVTEAGPVGILAPEPNSDLANSIFERVEVSMRAHQSRHVAIVAHHDCAGNPAPEHEQRAQLKQSAQAIRQQFPDAEVAALWVNDDWTVCEID